MSGLGDSALWGSSGNLIVCTRRALIRVDIENTGKAPRQDREVLAQIARTALEQLGI